ncbi:MAG: PAS domain-containing protein [Hyphomicrobiales bacterium]
MTELALTSTELKQLFDTIELQPTPQSNAVARGLDYWTAQRRNKVAPVAADVDPMEVPRFAAYFFIYDLAENGSRKAFRLRYLGDAIIPVTGAHKPGDLLAEAEETAFGEPARELFSLALDRGEPVCGLFHAAFTGAGDLSVEMFAAPVLDDADEKRRVFGALAFRHPEHGWEDQPSSVG